MTHTQTAHTQFNTQRQSFILHDFVHACTHKLLANTTTGKGKRQNR